MLLAAYSKKSYFFKNIRESMARVREEVSFQKYPEDLLAIRNKILNDTLEEKPSDVELPEGLKTVVESGAHIARRVAVYFDELRTALEAHNESLVVRIRSHILQTLGVTMRLCRVRQQQGLGAADRCKLVNVCIVVLATVARQVNSLRQLRYASSHEK